MPDATSKDWDALKLPSMTHRRFDAKTNGIRQEVLAARAAEIGDTGWECMSRKEKMESIISMDCEQAPKVSSALDTQVGGDHYTKLAIQPMEYSMKNNLDACQHTAIKYITRFRAKGGIQDLHKAKHVIDMLIELEGKA